MQADSENKRSRSVEIESASEAKRFRPAVTETDSTVPSEMAELPVSNAEGGVTTAMSESRIGDDPVTADPSGGAIDPNSGRPNWQTLPKPFSRLGLKPGYPDLPVSLELVTGIKTDLRAQQRLVGEEEVGIIGYAGASELKGIKGVIKQRFTDFLVHEVVPNGEILHLKDIGKPAESSVPKSDKGKGKQKGSGENDATGEVARGKKREGGAQGAAVDALVSEGSSPPEEILPENLRFEAHPKWPRATTIKLRPHLSDDTIMSFHALLLNGKDPPPKSDAGWGARKPQVEAEEEAMNLDGPSSGTAVKAESSGGAVGGRGQGRDRGRGRGGRGARGGRGGGRAGEVERWWMRDGDDREVVSQPVSGKDERTAAHKAIRELFGGIFESSTRQQPGESDQRLVIKWSRGNSQRRPERQGNDQGDQSQRKSEPYIHFTMQKSNRDTQDCLAHLSRLLGCHIKDLSVCGTKDKRAVTVQRVCLKRSGRNLVSVWSLVNGIKAGRNSDQLAVEQRADRGTRIGDLEYSTEYLDLGMLKGNHFVITLRTVQAESQQSIDATLASLRDRGFINFYGMQRFGTSTVPTHVTGLYILRNEWGKAVDSVLSLREGEHPDCMRARLAWLEDQDLGKALELMPRRCVAERSIWEHWSRGGQVEDKLGALGCIPRNLRTMYAHAYQSYIWNIVTSQRIKLSSTDVLVGDLVYASQTAEEEEEERENDDEHRQAHRAGRGNKPKKWKSGSEKEVKQLTSDDLAKYTIFDVLMTLPGFNVEYPGGAIGELYEKIMKADGLDPMRMRRDQREYSLPGDYRKIINKPARVSWSHIRYTDPDVAFVQTDEDGILGLNLPARDEAGGKFRALKVELTLGSSAYATMALREVTREETSGWHQMGLTMKSEDQGYKGSAGVGEVGEVVVGDEGEGRDEQEEQREGEGDKGAED